jgi:hypothetical protein
MFSPGYPQQQYPPNTFAWKNQLGIPFYPYQPLPPIQATDSSRLGVREPIGSIDGLRSLNLNLSNRQLRGLVDFPPARDKGTAEVLRLTKFDNTSTDALGFLNRTQNYIDRLIPTQEARLGIKPGRLWHRTPGYTNQAMQGVYPHNGNPSVWGTQNSWRG